jgi:hypothetical protein
MQQQQQDPAQGIQLAEGNNPTFTVGGGGSSSSTDNTLSSNSVFGGATTSSNLPELPPQVGMLINQVNNGTPETPAFGALPQ